MKKLFVSLFVIVFIFSLNVKAFADEGHSHDEENMDQMIDQFKKGTQTDSHSEHDTHSKHTEEDSNQSTHEHAAVPETPPNYKILGAYGVINLSFIVIGVWNKWFRRKEE